MKTNIFKVAIVAAIVVIAIAVYMNLSSPKPQTFEMIVPSTNANSGGSNTLAALDQPRVGNPVRLSSLVVDYHGMPVANQSVDFAIKTDFLGTNGIMEVGKAKTNAQGIAVMDYTPRLSGDYQVITTHGDTQSAAMISVANSKSPTYQASAGIHLPTIGNEVFVGSQTDGSSGAPPIVLRLPGGLTSWLLLFVAVIMLVWSTYFRAIFQVFQISGATRIRGGNTRIVPVLAMIFVLAAGSFLVLKIVTGPFTHLELPRG